MRSAENAIMKKFKLSILYSLEEKEAYRTETRAVLEGYQKVNIT